MLLDSILCPLEGVVLVQGPRFEDKRGYFAECIRASDFAEISKGKSIVQVNQCFSTKNVIRGLHFQNPHPQGKLVQVLKGAICDVAVDIRRSSPTFGQSYSVKLTEENGKRLYIPEGFAHGYSVLSDEALVLYSCTDYYDPSAEFCIAYNDKELQVDWMLEDMSQAILSEKDKLGKSVHDVRLFD